MARLTFDRRSGGTGRCGLALLLTLAGALAVNGCATPAPVQYATVGADLEPLKTAFNGDVDHVRAILLGSPT